MTDNATNSFEVHIIHARILLSLVDVVIVHSLYNHILMYHWRVILLVCNDLRELRAELANVRHLVGTTSTASKEAIRKKCLVILP